MKGSLFGDDMAFANKRTAMSAKTCPVPTALIKAAGFVFQIGASLPALHEIR